MAQLAGYPLEPPPEYYDIDNHQKLENKMFNVDEKIKSTLHELDNAKQELTKVRSFNKNIEKKIEEIEKERDSVQQKIDSLKTKLTVSNDSLNKCNDEKETIRTKLNDSQVLVARLEERLSAASSELDRMRDPANPDSNMSIKKHVVNDKKDIKKLKLELENEKNNLGTDIESSAGKDAEIKALEKELAKTKNLLAVCEKERTEMQEEEGEEIRKKEKMLDSLKFLKAERKTYDQRLKDAKIALGVKLSGKNVSEKLVHHMKKREKELTKQLNQYERKLKEANSDLDTLKNQHKMSKTALSINKYTKRTQLSRGADQERVSLAQSGLGTVSFATKSTKEQNGSTNKSKSSDQETRRSKDSSSSLKSTGKFTSRSTDAPQTRRKSLKEGPVAGGNTDRSTRSLPSIPSKDKGTAAPKVERQGTVVKSQNGTKKGENKNSVPLVPPPRAKLGGNR